MKRLLPLFCLLLLLSACRSKINEEPVWQAALPASGAAAGLANCTVEEGEGLYRKEDGTEQPVTLLKADGIPLLVLEKPEAAQLTVYIDFAKYLEDGVYGKDIASPMPKLDYVMTVREDGALEYRFDTVYPFYVEVSTENGTDALVLACQRDVGE